MSYQQSEKNRQAILDHLNFYPRKGAASIAESIGISRNSVESCVRFMTRRKEIEKIGNGKATVYVALVKQTISAAEVVRQMQARQASVLSGRKPAPNGKKSEPGYFSQRGGVWPATPGQGGQGAVRRAVTIQSVMA